MAENKPLLSRTGASEDLSAVVADVVLVFNLGKDKRGMCGGEPPKFKMTDDLQDEIFVERNKAVKTFTNLCSLKGETSMQVAQEALLRDLCKWFPKMGMDVKLFESCDGQELFMRLSLSDEVQRLFAEKHNMRLQTTPDLIEAMGLKQRARPKTNKDAPFSKEDVMMSPAYITYDQDREESCNKKLAEKGKDPDMFRKYFIKNPKGSLFRTVDRVRLIYAEATKLIDFDDLVKNGLLEAWFPCHNKRGLQHFQTHWIKRGLFKEQPTRRIRDYFGEGQGWYFAWQSYTMRCLVIAVVPSIINKILLVATSGHDSLLICAQAIFMVGWCAFYIVFWKREENFHKVDWDMEAAEGKQAVRCDYEGTMLADPLDENEKSKQYDKPLLAVACKLLSNMITVFFICMVAATMTTIYSPMVKGRLFDMLGKNGTTVVSVIIAIQIQVFDFLYSLVVDFLVWLENPRTNDEYNNMLVNKLFGFNFLNTYNAFIYTALYQRRSKAGCLNDDCIAYLQTSLYTTFMSQIAMAIVGMVLPKLQIYMALRKQMQSEAFKKGVPNFDTDPDAQKRSFMEYQNTMQPVTEKGQVQDFLQLMLAFGYVMLFGAVAPMVVVLGLILFVIKNRADAWKMCSVMRRPYPIMAGGIGVWNNCLVFLSICGLILSIAIPVLNHHSYDEWSIEQKFIFIVVLEHVLLAVRSVCTSLLPEEPAYVKLIKRQRNKLVETIFFADDDDDPPEADDLSNKKGRKSVIAKKGCFQGIQNPKDQAVHLKQDTYGKLLKSNPEWQLLEGEQWSALDVAETSEIEIEMSHIASNV